MEKENKPGVRIIYGNLEDYVERCKKKGVATIYFTVRENQREDKRIIATVELTAMDYGTEIANLIFVENKVSQPINSQEEYDLFKREFNLRLMGGDVEVIKEGKKEVMRVPGIIPYLQGEYAGAEIKAGWIGW
jgi:hypothetical protein